MYVVMLKNSLYIHELMNALMNISIDDMDNKELLYLSVNIGGSFIFGQTMKGF